MDVGGYRHNYEGLYEKSTYQMSINRGEQSEIKVPMQACGNSLLPSLSLLVKSFDKDIQPSRDNVDTVRG